LKCGAEMIVYMHEYLDEEISAEHEKILREHITNCLDCKSHFHQLRKTIALVQSTSHIKAPPDFTANIMANLPKEKRKVSIQRWLMGHPLLFAAAMFLLLMSGSIASMWSGDDKFSVSMQQNLVVQNDTVIVPEGEVVDGDVVVRNGTIKIEGEVHGNVTVINGDQYLASAGKVTGDIKEINEVFEWIWYHIQNLGEDMLNMFDEKEQNAS
jgi:anti-sigma factor RsiW